MRDTLKALFELQKIDTSALELERGADAIPRKITELEGSLESQRQELGVLNSEVDALKVEQQEIEARNAEESQKHRKWKSRLNEIKSPREYQALSRELELGERQIRESDERLIELMQEVENRQQVIDARAEALRGEERKVQDKVRELRQAQQKLEQDAEERRVGRDEVSAKLNKRILQRYETLRKKKGGIAVSLLREGTCTGCNMRMRPQHVVEILRFNTLEQCPNCQRILVHEALLHSDDA